MAARRFAIAAAGRCAEHRGFKIVVHTAEGRVCCAGDSLDTICDACRAAYVASTPAALATALRSAASADQVPPPPNLRDRILAHRAGQPPQRAAAVTPHAERQEQLAQERERLKEELDSLLDSARKGHSTGIGPRVTAIETRLKEIAKLMSRAASSQNCAPPAPDLRERILAHRTKEPTRTAAKPPAASASLPNTAPPPPRLADRLRSQTK